MMRLIKKEEIKRGPVRSALGRRFWFWIGLLFFVAACSGGVRRTDNPVLASKGGGTSGGTIQGELTVLVFDESTRFPTPGVIVSLGSGGDRVATTNSQGRVTFQGVSGPQDIHVFACGSCTGQDAQTQAFPYQITSFYQINAAFVAIPIVGRIPSSANGILQGKVFGPGKEEKAYVAAIDSTGQAQLTGQPISAITYQFLNDAPLPENPVNLTYLFSKDLDDWAAADPTAGRQAFNQVAILGTVVDEKNHPKEGITILARDFNGGAAHAPYYLNEAGVVDPALTATSSAGRFVFLRLAPFSDILIVAENLGTGVGAKGVNLLSSGTLVVSFPVLPLLQSRTDISGRVVEYRLDFREEERTSGALSGGNVPVPNAALVLSGDDSQSQAITAGSAPLVVGNYQSANHLLQNGEYTVSVFGGNAFRPTIQELKTGVRSQILNYPFAAVLQSDLTNILQVVQNDPAADLTRSNAEIVGRVVEETGAHDINGDPILKGRSDVTVQALDEAGVPIPESLYYLNENGGIDLTLTKTSASGGFVFFDLFSNPHPPSVFTVVVKDAADKLLNRRVLTLNSGTVRLIDLPVKNVTTDVKVTGILGSGKNPIADIALSLVGSVDCHDMSACSFSPVGDYLFRMEGASGGGDFHIPFAGTTHERVSLSSFKVSPAGELTGLSAPPSLAPLNSGTTVQQDIDFQSPPEFHQTTGSITLPTNFQLGDLQALLVGSVGKNERTLIGADPKVLLHQPVLPYRALSLPQPGALSYFLTGLAVNSKGEQSQGWIRGLLDIPSTQDITLMPPPRLLAPPAAAQSIGLTPQLSWDPPEDGPADFYQLFIFSPDGLRLWEAWTPGDVRSITLPPFPAGAPDLLKPFAAGTAVQWKVFAVRAGGLSLHQFYISDLADRIVGSSAFLSTFTP